MTALAGVLDIELYDVTLLDLGGVTNVRRELNALLDTDPEADVLGLCDAAEVRFVEQALREVGRPSRDEDDLSAYGFFVCHADLEEELIRALGTVRVLAVVEQLGLDGKLGTLRQQPAWADRPLNEQLHRFCGVASGRKELLAGELAGALGRDEVPLPLQGLMDRIAS